MRGDFILKSDMESSPSTKLSPLLFSLGSNPALSTEVSTALGIPLSPVKVNHFADGEAFVKPLCEVAGRECYIIHSTFNPVSERLMELLVCADALKRAGATKLIAIMPYFGYARQDRIVTPGDPISGLLVANMIHLSGIDEIVCVDFHSLKLFEQFPFPHSNLSAMALLAKKVEDAFVANSIKTSDVCVVSPDHGGVKRAMAFASLFYGSSFAYAEKSRPEPNKACVQAIQGIVKDKRCLIIDDMIDTAGTLCEVSKALYASGAKSVWAAATHGVLSGKAMDNIAAAKLEKMFLTNTIEAPHEVGESVSIAPLLESYLRSKGF